MKEMKLTETQLRSWQPRRPSLGLKRRILSDSAHPAELGRTELRRALGWLAPAMACMLLALASFNRQQGIGYHSSYGDATPDFAHSPFAYLVGDWQSERNSHSPVILEWTNHSGFTSSVGSFLPGKVN
jgi:hypothetical protein